MVTRKQVLESLKMVIDPELGISVVDLGLIYDIDVEEDAIHVTMTLTTAGCPLHESMVEAVRQVVQMTDLTKTVDVQLVWEPPWTPERLTPAAKQMLGWHGSEM
jgi:metal-sulfur cluster biosynthetic enzyme